MKINVAQAKQEFGGVFPFRYSVTGEQLGLDSEDTPGKNSTVIVEGEVVNNGRALAVRGLVQTTGIYACGRCLDAVSLKVEGFFSENYVESGTDTNDEDDVLFTGDEIDITELVRENLIMAEPLTPVCKADCRGLCSECGIDLNAATCSCDRRSVDPRLAVLNELLARSTNNDSK